MSMETWSAGHLPGLREDEMAWHVLPFAAAGQQVQVRVPVLTPAQLGAVTRRVKAASAQHLKTLPVSRIVQIVDAAVRRLLDPADPMRREAEHLLPVVSGYDAEMVRLGLNGFLQSFRAPQLHRFVAEDFANPKLLDEFQPAPKGGAVRAFGPELLVHSWAGNVPALPLWSLACGLLVKAGTVGKLPSAEPVFASLFARLL
ncbi:MAG TPA: acyl-CoA reductase, partial [Ramlibacter sp.]|uniref:acyl-CoA reductase n=1 Tax=Ramlibacter sp. TaxID=1917967 RepID=UPI002D7EE19D